MREVYLKVQYLVCWAGCNVMLENRLFDRWDEALAYFGLHSDKLSLRIEEITTRKVSKIVWPK